jgi:3-oxoadipate enol-lactonase
MPLLSVAKEIQVHYEIDDFTNPWDNRPTLFLQHGNGRSGAFWYPWIPLLARDYRIVRVDMRGLGQSSSITNASQDIQIELCINDLVKVISELNCGPILFCGESMGGILGIILAATHPNLIKALALVSTPVFINQAMKSKYSLGFGSRLEAMHKMGIKEWVYQTSVLARFPPETNPKLLQWYVDEFSKSTPEVLIHYSDLVNSANATEFLKDIQCPTLAIMPSNGPITDPKQIEILEAQIPQLKIATINSDFHMIHITHVEPCVNLVREFFSDLL